MIDQYQRKIDDPDTPKRKRRGMMRAVVDGAEVWGEIEEIEKWAVVPEVEEVEKPEVGIGDGGEEHMKNQRERREREGEVIVFTDWSLREGRVRGVV